ncbi:MAG: TetR/AcrR family transcriptional regulator [Parvibaculaceae bacterium]
MAEIIEKEPGGMPGDAPRPLGKRERTKATNREAILTAAQEVFGELGYGGTTVRDIIRKTGLASGTFYNYFKSKEEVFEALMDDSMMRLRPRLRAERIRSRTFEEYLRNTLRAYFEYLIEDQAAHRVMRRNAGALRVRMDTPEVIAGFEEIRTYIEEDIASGKLRKVDGEYLTAAAIGLAQEIGEKLMLRDEPDAREAADFAANLILKGIPGLALKE